MTTQEVIKSLRMIKSTCYIGNRKFLDALEQAVEMLEAQEWIPVKKLPKKDGSYLVSGRWGSEKEMVGECEYKVHDGYFSTAWNFDVLAWRNLPEPYKEDT